VAHLWGGPQDEPGAERVEGVRGERLGPFAVHTETQLRQEPGVAEEQPVGVAGEHVAGGERDREGRPLDEGDDSSVERCALARRPRLPLSAALAAALILSACSLLKPEQTAEDKQEHAQHLAQTGKHAEAAQAYAELATLEPAAHDNYQLLSTEQWLAAGNIGAAKQAFAAVSADARTKLATPRALVAAEIAYAENDGARAIHELDQIPVPTSADQAQNYWWIRGRSAFLTAHPVEGTRALVERERWLTDPAALRANRTELYERIRSAAEHGQSLKAPVKTDPIVLGWLELGPVAVSLARDPMRATTALNNWKRLYPQHPANDSVLASATTQIAAATEFPDQIALLLPLSGRAEPVGAAVRDGFIAAYLEQDPAKRPRLRIYDVTSATVSGAYNQAILDGAGFVVGPLTKEDVSAVVPLSNGRVPVLALNFLGDSVVTPGNFYQFALSPEDEARGVARRVAADGRLNGVVIVPANEWGNRVGKHYLIQEPEADGLQRHEEILTVECSFLLYLRQKNRGANDRPGDQLGEEGNV